MEMTESPSAAANVPTEETFDVEKHKHEKRIYEKCSPIFTGFVFKYFLNVIDMCSKRVSNCQYFILRMFHVFWLPICCTAVRLDTDRVCRKVRWSMMIYDDLSFDFPSMKRMNRRQVFKICPAFGMRLVRALKNKVLRKRYKRSPFFNCSCFFYFFNVTLQTLYVLLCIILICLICCHVAMDQFLILYIVELVAGIPDRIALGRWNSRSDSVGRSHCPSVHVKKVASLRVMQHLWFAQIPKNEQLQQDWKTLLPPAKLCLPFLAVALAFHSSGGISEFIKVKRSSLRSNPGKWKSKHIMFFMFIFNHNFSFIIFYQHLVYKQFIEHL